MDIAYKTFVRSFVGQMVRELDVFIMNSYKIDGAQILHNTKYILNFTQGKNSASQ